MDDYKELFVKAREAYRTFAKHDCIDEFLIYLADQLEENIGHLLVTNQMDLNRISQCDSKPERLNANRISNIANEIRNLASLPSPLGKILKQIEHPNGLKISKISAPIGVVFESRPNAVFDVFSLCIKSGNACVLTSDLYFNETAVALIHKALKHYNINPAMLTLLPPESDTNGYVDIVITPDCQGLAESTIVPKTEKVVHVYYDKTGYKSLALEIINNSKTRRDNALDCLIVHSSRLLDLSMVFNPLADAQVVVYADERAMQALHGRYPFDLLKPADENSYGTKFLGYKMAVKTVDNIEEAVEHISRYGSRHCEAIVSEDAENIEFFVNRVDSVTVYINTYNAYTDDYQLDFDSKHVNLDELTSYKWVIRGMEHLKMLNYVELHNIFKPSGIFRKIE